MTAQANFVRGSITPSIFNSLARRIRLSLCRMEAAMEAAHQVDKLTELDDAQLRDIGMARNEIPGRVATQMLRQCARAEATEI